MEHQRTVTCKFCGWVHFQVSLAHAKDEVARFNAYFATLDKQKQDDYYGGHGSSIEQYISCGCCGGSYKNFRYAEKGDCPMGCTLNPIIARDEELDP